MIDQLLKISLIPLLALAIAASKESNPKLGEACRTEGAHVKNGVVEVTHVCTKGKWHENGPWLVPDTDGAGCKDTETKTIIRKSELLCQSHKWVLPYAP